MSDDIKAGDKIWLKSGGPPMTVRALDVEHGTETPIADCEWFDGAKLNHGWFPITSLTKIKP